MATLLDYSQKLKSQFDIDMTQTEISENLTNHCFSRDTFKLLNKNLNFIPTPYVYNEQKLDKEL